MPLRSPWTITCDASPWGGGGVLWLGGNPIEYTHFVWSQHTLDTLKACVAHTSQTVFEFFTIYLVLLTFRRIVTEHGVLLGGDNLTSLQNLLNLRSGKTDLNSICREIS